MKPFILALAVFISYSSSVNGQLTVTKIFIVRHANRLAGDALSPAGITRAKELKRVLLLAKIDSIFSTNTIRTRKTAEPLAVALSLPVKLYAGAPEVISRINLLSAGKRVLIVGHSDTVDDLIIQCGGIPPPSIVPSMPDTQFDNLFEVIITKSVCAGIVSRKIDVIQLKYGLNTP